MRRHTIRPWEHVSDTTEARYTGKPCVKCGGTERYCTSKACTACIKERNSQIMRERTVAEVRKLTRATVREIEALEGVDGPYKVAKAFNISHSRVIAIWNGTDLV